MNGFYQFTTKIKDTLKLDPFVNTVTYGDIFQVDLSKQTIFPLSHLVVNNVTKESNVMRFNISILAMDIVDMTKDETTDIFIGNDNTHDIWNTQLKVLDRLTELLRRGSIVSDGYQLDGNPTFEQFTERFENYLAGWTVTFDVIVGNDMTICEVGASGGACSPASYIITDSNDLELYNGTIASGLSDTIVIRDASVENSDASYSDVIVAEGTLVLPDIRVDVVNSASTIVNTTTSPSVQDVTISAPDGTVNIKKFGDGTIHSEVVASGATVNYSVADNAITVNNANSFTIDATDPLDIRLQDSNGTTLTPNSVTPNQGSHHVDIVLPAAPAPTYATARVLKTGQTVSTATYDDGDLERGRLTSFLVLSTPNPFGNTNRFTNKTGGQTYTNSVAYDWSTFDGSSVSAYYFGDSNTRTWATQLSQYATSTIDGLSNWYLFNIHEAFSLMNFSYPNSYLYGYAPFSLTRRYMWVSTNETGTTGIATETAMGGAPFTASNKASGLWGIWTRVCTVSGTTIT